MQSNYLIANRQSGLMAWVLQAVAEKGDKLPVTAHKGCFRLAPGSHSLGRKGTSIVLQGDESISRTHAHLIVPDGDSDSVQITGVIYKWQRRPQCIAT